MRAEPASISALVALSLLSVPSCGPGPNPQGGGAGGGAAADASADSSFGACAEAIYDARQEPAALLVVLDRSSSMAKNNKWTFAAQAIVQALDQDVFDSLYVGLYAAPTAEVEGPACIFNLPVACGTPPFPQVDLQLAGAQKSSAPGGPRRQIKDWLSANAPDAGWGDASPMYDAVQAAILTLQGWPMSGKRILLVVTDGSMSCAEFSGRAGFGDCNGCTHDWEDPRNLAALVAGANADPAKPVETFVIGVPGADTYDSSGCSYPPYRMRLALSSIAAAGAPAYVPADCDGRTFTEAGADPARSCHFDMTTGAFGTAAVADTISFIRGEALGCVFDLPTPPAGGAVDPNEVNVEYTADGVTVGLARRSSPSDPCTDTGCWDYTTDGRVELIGKACADVKSASSGGVKIVVGCATVIK